MPDFPQRCKDGLPALWPHPPLWPSNPRIKDFVLSQMPPGMLPIIKSLLGNSEVQIKLDDGYKRASLTISNISDDTDPMTYHEFITTYKLLHTGFISMPTGTRKELNQARSIQSLKAYFNKQLMETNWNPSAYRPSEVPVQLVCDHCKKPCTSMCVCGEVFCSRSCLRKGWKKHQRVCDIACENIIGVTVTHVEMRHRLTKGEYMKAIGADQ